VQRFPTGQRAIVAETPAPFKAQLGRRDGGLGEVPDLVEALRDRHRIRRRVQRNNRARLLVVHLVPDAVVVGDHERIGGVARLRERAVDLDRHRELAQQRDEARAVALQRIGLVQRDQQAVGAPGDQELAQPARCARAN
jgi:hypothetical protein